MKLPNLPIPMNFLKTAKFSRREKYSILAVSGLIFCIAFFQLVVSPIIEKRDRLARNISVKTRVLEDIIALSQEYKAVKKWADFSKERIIKRDKNFSLFSFLDHLADKAKIKKNITYMKPSTKAKNSLPTAESLYCLDGGRPPPAI